MSEASFSQNFIESIIRAVPIGIGVVKNRFFQQVNDRILEMTGYSREELIGKNARILYPTDQDYEYVGKEKYEQINQHGTGTVETRWLRKDGTIIYILLSSTPINRQDFSLGVTFTALDISDRKKSELERLELERRIQHGQKLESLGVLAGGIAHDFNNLLMAILGNLDLALFEIYEASPAYGYIKEAEKEIYRATSLTKQLLAYSGKGKYLIESINLNELVDDMKPLLITSISKKAELKIQLDSTNPIFNGDRAQTQQIILNLILNASEALEDKPGSINVATGIQYCDLRYLQNNRLNIKIPPGEYVFLEVNDTGCGMDETTKNRLFEPFFTTKFTGRGLGLSAVLGIVKGHKGAIIVNSEPGKGSTFKILFPKVYEILEKQDSVEIQKTQSKNIPTFSGTVLVVDDEPNILKVVNIMLRKMGFSVITATNGEEAIELFKTHSQEIECIILDLTMPKIDGTVAFSAFRSIRSDIKIILSSGYNQQEVTQRFAGKGLTGFIQKPYQYDTIQKELIRVLEQQTKI
jgi:PAS domain S-box-containing protein